MKAWTLVLAAAGLSSLALAQRVTPRPWPQESSDIPADPRLHFGVLENGLRFAWASNGEPAQHCCLRLHVAVGSLAEEDGERGMAHFLEHMAFNGSAHFPAGALAKWFQRHGLALGADSNASTGYSRTVYVIDLPAADATSIGQGLGVLRDFADGLLLSEAEVEREKGVIDGEERESDSAERRLITRRVTAEFAGTRLPLCDPLGTKSARDGFDSAALRRFYAKWYRADAMTVVVVGDFGKLDPAPLVRAAFQSLPAPSGARPVPPALGGPTLHTPFFYLHEPEVPVARIWIDRLTTEVSRTTTRAHLQEQLPLDLALVMLGVRLAELARQENAPFLSAGIADEQELELRHFGRAVCDGLSLTCVATPETWKAALTACEQEVRRAIRHGFRLPELLGAQAAVLGQALERVQVAKKQPSAVLVDELLSAADGTLVPSDTATLLALRRAVLEKVTVDHCRDALAAAWDGGRLVIGLGGGVELGENALALLSRAHEASTSAAAPTPTAPDPGRFAYASTPTNVPQANRSEIADLGLLRASFPNGVELFVKKTDFEPHTIHVRVSAGEGLLGLEPERCALGYVATRVFKAAGLAAHGEDELRSLSGGSRVEFRVEADRCLLAGATVAPDLLRECEVLCAYLDHPGWREEGMARFAKTLAPEYEGYAHAHESALRLSFLPELHGGDPRFGVPSRASVEAVKLADVRAWLEPALRGAPVQVVFVGDVEVERVLKAAAQTFGKLAPRRALEAHADRRRVTVQGGLRREYEIDTEIRSSLVAVAFPAGDVRAAARRWDLAFLGTILSDRLREVVREELGASYSPSASADVDERFEGGGILWLQSTGAPGRESAVADACLAVARTLAEQGTTDEEIGRLRRPFLEHLRAARDVNDFWVEVLTDALRRPEALDELRSVEEHFRGLRARALNDLAREVLRSEQASVAIVRPALTRAPAQAR
jgi:zinc protease